MASRLSFSERKTRTQTSLGISHERFPLVMSVLNVTPDSFSDGGQFQTTDAIKKQCDYFVEHDTDIIDVGGESTRPGSEPVTLEDEWAGLKTPSRLPRDTPQCWLASIRKRPRSLAAHSLRVPTSSMMYQVFATPKCRLSSLKLNAPPS